MLKKLLILTVSVIAFLSCSSVGFASTLTLSPGTTTVPQGSIVSVSVKLNTQGESINGISSYLSYPKDLIEVSSITYGSSAFGIAAESSYGGGSIRISRGSINGVVGSSVSVATINFKGKTQGKGTVAFISGSAAPRTINSTDSLNLGGSVGATVTVVPPKPIVPKQDLAIKNISISLVSTNSATITWSTDTDSDSEIEYGLQEGRYILSSYDKTLGKEHKMVIGEDLIPGETIYFRVSSKDKLSEGVSKEMTLKLKGYTVTITVLDSNNNPAVGAEVTLYSAPVKQTTNQQGVATFTDISPNRHLVVVKANDMETSKEITVNDDNLSEFTLIMTEPSGANNTLLGIFYASLAIIIVSIAIGVVLLRRKIG